MSQFKVGDIIVSNYGNRYLITQINVYNDDDEPCYIYRNLDTCIYNVSTEEDLEMFNYYKKIRQGRSDKPKGIQYWRDDAIESSAVIAERYGYPEVAEDIRKLKSGKNA